MILGLVAVALIITGAIKAHMNKQKVAIFSADRRKLQGKKPNVLAQTFKSHPQAGKINTQVVSPTIGPSNPSGL